MDDMASKSLIKSLGRLAASLFSAREDSGG